MGLKYCTCTFHFCGVVWMLVLMTKYADSCMGFWKCVCAHACPYKYMHMSKFLTKFCLWRFHFFSPILPQLETHPNTLYIENAAVSFPSSSSNSYGMNTYYVLGSMENQVYDLVLPLITPCLPRKIVCITVQAERIVKTS